MNPSAKMYSFQDATRGTDLKWSLDRLPVFWRSRTKEVDVNHNVDLRALQNHSVVAFERMNHPWPKVPVVFSLSLATYDWWRHFFVAASRVSRCYALLTLLASALSHANRSAIAMAVVPIVDHSRITPHTEAFQAVVWHGLVSHPDLRQVATKR